MDSRAPIPLRQVPTRKRCFRLERQTASSLPNTGPIIHWNQIWINEALQGHCQHVGVQMRHTMRLGHMHSGDLGGSADQAQNPSGWCLKVSISALTVPRLRCLSDSPQSSFPPLPIPPLPLLWRKLNISGLHQNALIPSSTALSISVWGAEGPASPCLD